MRTDLTTHHESSAVCYKHYLLVCIILVLSIHRFGFAQAPRKLQPQIIQSGPCMATHLHGNTLLMAGQRTLYCYDLSKPQSPKLVGQISGLGDVRQMHMAGNVALITSREDGLFLVDVANPKEPRLLSHYDTNEKATGLTVSGNLAFVGNRHHGIECIDITSPMQPHYVSSLQIGEVQSATVHDNYLYAGLWLDNEISILDIKNPNQLKEVGKVNLQGYGDGVWVHDGYLYAATGHHQRVNGKVIKKRRTLSRDHPSYGTGHALEIFDLKNPAKPKFVSRVQLPKLYNGYMDLWSVQVNDQYAYVADTFNGLYIIDIKDKRHPQIIARCKLPTVNLRNKPVNDPVTSLAIGKGKIYATGGLGHFYVIDAPGMAQTIEQPSTQSSREHVNLPKHPLTSKQQGWLTWQVPDAQFRDVLALDDEHLIAAGGSRGIYIINVANGIDIVQHQPTTREARTLSRAGNRLAVAQGDGLTLWQIDDGDKPHIQLLGQWQNELGASMQAVFAANGNLVLSTDGDRQFQIIDVSNPKKMKVVYGPVEDGLFYRRSISVNNENHAVVQWNRAGPQWYDLSNPSSPQKVDIARNDAANDVTWYQDQVWMLHRNSVKIMPENYAGKINQLPEISFEKQPLNGMIHIQNNLLFAINQAWGIMRVVDIKHIDKPIFLGQWSLKPGHPNKPLIHQQKLWMPNGYAGLWVRPLADF